MKPLATLPWAEPLALARRVPESEERWALLYSGMRLPFTGRYSFLALRPEREVAGGGFSALADALTRNRAPYDNAWFGYLGYGLKNTLEKLPEDLPGLFALPDLWMIRYRLLLVFDHDERRIDIWGEDWNELAHVPPPVVESPSPPPIPSPRLRVGPGAEDVGGGRMSDLASNMTRAEYLEKVAAIREAIARGDLYQANLTRKFYGEFAAPPQPFALFSALCRISPAPYGAFLKLGDTSILSSSPEQFVRLDRDGHAQTRPIKGSAPRESDPAQLAASEKDRAENLMIVDLMRNDFSRGAITGSVKTESLFDVTSYATVHHMSSTVTARKREEISAMDFIKNCFPPGSMTGAPKIKAMELCSALEHQARGVYSGALGWFGGDGSADLSVVIRTLILQGSRFEFQTGGAIVTDSDPEAEWRETLLKARAIAQTLGIGKEALAAL